MALPVRRTNATPTTWRPYRGFDDIYSEFDRLVQSLVGGAGSDAAWLPAADVSETDAAYVVEIELPGVRREDIDVELDGNELVVTGEVKEREREGLLRRRTRRVGNFEYRVTLPGDFKTDDVQASLAHGVLTVQLPKAQANKHNKIQVSESSGEESSSK
jgi:HSP20 family protein